MPTYDCGGEGAGGLRPRELNVGCGARRRSARGALHVRAWRHLCTRSHRPAVSAGLEEEVRGSSSQTAPRCIANILVSWNPNYSDSISVVLGFIQGAVWTVTTRGRYMITQGDRYLSNKEETRPEKDGERLKTEHRRWLKIRP
ncbi:hypothetical protein NDU88_000510 [Pleurodeles waltl]|uniref:Uncharacterized protein n=1 Tax=Pleurodeles waltl TaxID=8319 RepID=A0AAV7U566_PLEWA|nr:hypothetical protein NDU88_000510 [Pleurodeles waltl]